MNAIKCLAKKFSTTEEDLHRSLTGAERIECEGSGYLNRMNWDKNRSKILSLGLKPQIQEIRRIMSEEMKIEREARAIPRRRSTALSVSTSGSFASSGAVSRVHSPVVNEVCDEPFADFQTHEAWLLSGSGQVNNPFITGLCEVDESDRLVASLCELSDTAFESVIRQVVQKRASSHRVLNEVLN